MLTVFVKVLVIFSMVAIGFIANKAGILPIESNKYLVNLLLEITTPCMILGSMASNKLTPETLHSTIEVAVGSLAFFMFAWAVGLLIVKLMRYEPKEDRGIMIVIITGINAGFMGFPVTKSIFGNKYLFLMVIVNCMLTFYLYFLSVLQMNYGHKKKESFKEILKPLFNMCMLASVLGLIVFGAGIALPAPLLDFLNTIGDSTIPISMFVVGIQLGNCELKKTIRNGKLLAASVSNVLIIPAATWLAVNWLPITTDAKLTLVFAASFPCAVATVAVATREGRNANLMAEGVALTTLLSMVTLPLAALILMAVYL